MKKVSVPLIGRRAVWLAGKIPIVANLPFAAAGAVCAVEIVRREVKKKWLDLSRMGLVIA
jgi:hypothetical protein